MFNRVIFWEMIVRISFRGILNLGFTFGYPRIPRCKPTGFFLDG